MKDKETSVDRLIKSLKNKSRYSVVECAVFLEEKTSQTLGFLLGIEWKNSKSLGYGRFNIGFANKISLIQDMKGIEDQAKFETFMAIRNKFAHKAEIDSFASLFGTIESSNDWKNKFKKWFPHLKWDSQGEEELYKTAYLLLTIELYNILMEIDLKHAIDKGKEQGRREILEEFYNQVKERLKGSEFGNEILREVSEKIFKSK